MLRCPTNHRGELAIFAHKFGKGMDDARFYGIPEWCAGRIFDAKKHQTVMEGISRNGGKRHDYPVFTTTDPRMVKRELTQGFIAVSAFELKNGNVGKATQDLSVVVFLEVDGIFKIVGDPAYKQCRGFTDRSPHGGQ